MASRSACVLLALACAVAGAAAFCDPAVVGKIKAMHPDDNQFAAAIDQLPGNYEVVSIYMGQRVPESVQGNCLKMTITKENGKILIRFGGVNNFAYPLKFKDGKLLYTGTNKLENDQEKQKNKEKGEKEAGNGVSEEDEFTVTISYYIVDHSPEAVSFYTCSDRENEPVLAFTAVIEARVNDGEQRANQATAKLKEIGIDDLITVPFCKDAKKVNRTKKWGGGKGKRGGKGGKAAESGGGKMTGKSYSEQ